MKTIDEHELKKLRFAAEKRDRLDALINNAKPSRARDSVGLAPLRFCCPAGQVLGVTVCGECAETSDAYSEACAR